jgi:hypothetical protein
MRRTGLGEAIEKIAICAMQESAGAVFEALLANSSDGMRRTYQNGTFEVRRLSRASLAFARRAVFDPQNDTP